MFSPGETPDLAAILDWELATIGDPLADVGYMAVMWSEPGDRDTPMTDLSAATRLPGFLSREEIRQRYVVRSGRDLIDIEWYEVLGLWKAAIFLECSYTRFVAGRSKDEYFATLKDGVPALGDELTQRIASVRSG